ATLLAGFAMATPAFAAVPRTVSTDEAKDDSFALKTLKAALKKAYDDADQAETKKDNSKKDATILDADGNLLNKADYKLDDKGEVVKAADGTKDEAANKANTYLTDLKAYKAALEAVKTAEEAVNAATPKVEPSKDAKRVALAKLDEAKEKLGKAQEAKDKAFAEADAAYNAKHEAENNLKAAQRALKDYQDENAKDKGSRAYNAEVESLKKVINEAKEALAAAKTKFADADKAFNEAATKFNKALSEYAGAYKNAQDSKADVSTYATPASLAPLSTDYKYGTNFVPSATVQPGKPGAAKPGKPGQAAGQAG
ncbi:hypothetical protein HMPREF1579_00778, partial [Gardnerella vaginalis JCP8066]